MHEEGLANELASEFYLRNNLKKISKTYLKNAFNKYKEWEFNAKCNQMLEQNKGVLSESELPVFNSQNTVTGIEIFKPNLSNLDLSSILKTSITLSEEVNLDDILVKLMNIIIQNAGAEVGYFLLQRKTQWMIEASISLDHQSSVKLNSVPIVGKDGMPLISNPRRQGDLLTL